MFNAEPNTQSFRLLNTLSVTKTPHANIAITHTHSHSIWDMGKYHPTTMPATKGNRSLMDGCFWIAADNMIPKDSSEFQWQQ